MPAVDHGPVTLDDLEGRNFATIEQAAKILQIRDRRTMRSAIANGEIPAVKVGAQYRVPVAWLRQQAQVGAVR